MYVAPTAAQISGTNTGGAARSFQIPGGALDGVAALMAALQNVPRHRRELEKLKRDQDRQDSLDQQARLDKSQARIDRQDEMGQRLRMHDEDLRFKRESLNAEYGLPDAPPTAPSAPKASAATAPEAFNNTADAPTWGLKNGMWGGAGQWADIIGGPKEPGLMQNAAPSGNFPVNPYFKQRTQVEDNANDAQMAKQGAESAKRRYPQQGAVTANQYHPDTLSQDSAAKILKVLPTLDPESQAAYKATLKNAADADASGDKMGAEKYKSQLDKMHKRMLGADAPARAATQSFGDYGEL